MPEMKREANQLQVKHLNSSVYNPNLHIFNVERYAGWVYIY